MGIDHRESQPRAWFPARIRDLRVAAHKKQREVGLALGLATSSYANAESDDHKRMSKDRVLMLARLYQLSEVDTEELVRGWEALPASDYKARQTEGFEKRKAFRSKARRYDGLRVAAIGLASLFVASLVDDTTSPCTCTPPDEAWGDLGTTCELCAVLEAVGAGRWTDRESVIAKLAALQEAA